LQVDVCSITCQSIGPRSLVYRFKSILLLITFDTRISICATCLNQSMKRPTRQFLWSLGAYLCVKWAVFVNFPHYSREPNVKFSNSPFLGLLNFVTVQSDKRIRLRILLHQFRGKYIISFLAWLMMLWLRGGFVMSIIVRQYANFTIPHFVYWMQHLNRTKLRLIYYN
jgi:hypothetical protein